MKKFWDTFKKVIYFTVGIFAIIYFILAVLWAWVGVSWLWIWPLLAAFCAVRLFLIYKDISAPKWFSTTYRICLAIAVWIFVVIEGRVIYSMSKPAEPNLDYIITLGCAVRGTEPTSPLRLRIQKTYEYLTENEDTIAILSGGQGSNENISEAECMKRELIKLGINEERLVKEDKSTDTNENIINSFKFIPDGSSVGIVTNSFHLYRAELIANRLGYEVSEIGAKTYLPLGIHYTVREFFAVMEMDIPYFFQKDIIDPIFKDFANASTGEHDI